MYVIQVDNGIVTGTLHTSKIPDEGLPPGRVMVHISDEDVHVGDDQHWLFGAYNTGNGQFVRAQTPAPVSSAFPTQLDQLLSDIRDIKKKLKVSE